MIQCQDNPHHDPTQPFIKVSPAAATVNHLLKLEHATITPDQKTQNSSRCQQVNTIPGDITPDLQVRINIVIFSFEGSSNIWSLILKYLFFMFAPQCQCWCQEMFEKYLMIVSNCHMSPTDSHSTLSSQHHQHQNISVAF